MVQKVMNRVSRAGDTSALRKQILGDILGNNVDEYENFHRETADKKRQHRTRVPLWKFLLHLLHRDKDGVLIEWNADHILEFRIKDPAAMAILWGSVKNKTDMTYEKFGRAMRYYYGKNIIEKVNGRRYSYRFVLSNRTRRYISSNFVFDLPPDNEVEVAPLDSCEEDDDVDEDEICEKGRQQPASKPVHGSGKSDLHMTTSVQTEAPDTKLASALDLREAKVSPSDEKTPLQESESILRASGMQPNSSNDRCSAPQSHCDPPAVRTITRILKPEELRLLGINVNFDNDHLPAKQTKFHLTNDGLAQPHGQRFETFGDGSPTLTSTFKSLESVASSPWRREKHFRDRLAPSEGSLKICDDFLLSPVKKRVRYCDSLIASRIEKRLKYGDDAVPRTIDEAGRWSCSSLSADEERRRFLEALLPPFEKGKNSDAVFSNPLRVENGSRFWEGKFGKSDLAISESTSRVFKGDMDTPSSFPSLISLPGRILPESCEACGCFRSRHAVDRERQDFLRPYTCRSSTGSISDNGSEGGDSVSSCEQGRQSPTVTPPVARQRSSHYRTTRDDHFDERIDAQSYMEDRHIYLDRPHGDRRNFDDHLFRCQSKTFNGRFIDMPTKSDIHSPSRFRSDDYRRTGFVPAP